jgi:hypothetical protein
VSEDSVECERAYRQSDTFEDADDEEVVGGAVIAKTREDLGFALRLRPINPDSSTLRFKLVACVLPT